MVVSVECGLVRILVYFSYTLPSYMTLAKFFNLRSSLFLWV